MRPTVRVRTADLADVAELVRITEGAAVPPSRGSVAPDRSGRYTALMAAPDHIVLAAVDERSEQIVGVAVAAEDDVGSLVAVPAIIVSHLVVELPHRRRGVGRALLAGIVREAEERGIEQVVVSVTSANRDANRYLARLGFSPMVVRRVAGTGVLRRTLGMGELAGVASLRMRRRRRPQAALAGRASRGA